MMLVFATSCEDLTGAAYQLMGYQPEPEPVPVAAMEIGKTGSCPSTKNLFVETRSMLTPRAFHTATLLNNGQVLIAGGSAGESDAALDSAELYDPLIGGFASTGKMATTRAQAVAVRLADGRVLIAGGLLNRPLIEEAAQAAVSTPASKPAKNATLSSAEIFDPAGGTFIRAADMSVSRAEHSATLLDSGKVLIAGGYADFAELYDPAKDEFTPGAKMIAMRWGNTAVKLKNGKLLIACGAVTPSLTKSAELYDPGTGKFSRTGDMLTPMFECESVALPNGKALVTGYASDDPKAHDAELYDPATGQFSATGPLQVAIANPVPVLLNDGRALITSSGVPTDPLTSDRITAEIYEPGGNAFTQLGSVPPDRVGYSSSTLQNGSVLLAGGRSTHGDRYPGTSLLYCP